MKEIDLTPPKTPLSVDELAYRIVQFPRALEKVRQVKEDISKSRSGFISNRIGPRRKDFSIVDDVVIKAMNGGIERIYEDLVRSGYKKFADGVIKIKTT